MMMTGKPSLRAAMNPLRWFLGGSVQGDLANGLVPSVVLGGPGASRDPANWQNSCRCTGNGRDRKSGRTVYDRLQSQQL